MPTTDQEIPALPVVVPLALVALAVLWWRLHRRGALTVLRAVVGVALCAYGAGIVAHTVLPIHLDRSGSGTPWWRFLNLIPLAGTEWADMLQNVLVFVPLGALLPLVAAVRSSGRALLGGFLVSLTMEALQFGNAVTGHGGHIADVNDLLANTLGALVGYGVFRVALLVRSWTGWPAPRPGRSGRGTRRRSGRTRPPPDGPRRQRGRRPLRVHAFTL